MSRRAARFANAEPETGVVVRLNAQGRGVIETDEHTVLVDDALPGEQVRYLRRRRNRRHDEADIVEILRAAPERVTPRCDAFGVCGGCRWQHVSPDAQVASKQARVLELFREQGLAPRELLEPLTGDDWGYRRRARLGAKFVIKRDRVLVGFRERRKPYITDMHGCPVLASPCDRLIEPLATLLDGLAVRERLPQIEVAVADNATALVFRVLDQPGADDLAALRAFAEREDVLIYLQPGGLDTVQALDGTDPVLEYALPDFDVRLRFQPTDFLQVNGPLNRAMVTAVVDRLNPGSGDSVLELFSGIGNFTLPLARRSGAVTAVEGDASLVERAQANAARNGLNNVVCHTADLYGDGLDPAHGPPPAWAARRYELLLLDPPRAGAGAVLALVPGIAPRRIAYVACDPSTLATDARVLVEEQGFALSSLGIMDMFPHTDHVETFALFDRPPAAGAS
ncbi:MAG: 23S rRNA (uracil(1939)-C(5))-methyltransferase RlmD [Pseudomonadota bacterium]